MVTYKIGWYADDLEEVFDEDLDVEDMNNTFIKLVAQQFANNNHEICEDSDMEFSVFVEVDGHVTEVRFKTEFDPVYYVTEIV
jgi:hypothetical protein